MFSEPQISSSSERQLGKRSVLPAVSKEEVSEVS